jgi:hypothetical protein
MLVKIVIEDEGAGVRFTFDRMNRSQMYLDLWGVERMPELRSASTPEF